MLDLNYLSKDRIETTIDILKRVKKFGGKLDLGVFSAYDNVSTLEDIHPCGNAACILGYVSLSQEWQEAGGDTINGNPLIKGMPYVDRMDRHHYAALWFTGNPINSESFHYISGVSRERTLAAILAEAVCLLLKEDYAEELDTEIVEELNKLFKVSLLDISTNEYPYSRELNYLLIDLIYRKDIDEIGVDEAIEALEWLSTLEITK